MARCGSPWIGVWPACVAGGSPDVSEMFKTTYVYAFHEDPDGSMWLGTSNGLYVHRGASSSLPGFNFGLPDGAVNAIWRGADQVLWIGTAGGGLFRIPGSKAEAVARESGPIWSGLNDRSGTLWIAGDHGLKTLREHELRTAFAEQGLAGRVLTLFEDREGSLWAGTRYSGVVRLTAGKVLSIGHELEFPSVLSVHEDRGGHVWFGTAGGGLGRLDDDRLTVYGIREGLVSDIVGPILEDREGRLLVRSARGQHVAAHRERPGVVVAARGYTRQLPPGRGRIAVGRHDRPRTLPPAEGTGDALDHAGRSAEPRRPRHGRRRGRRPLAGHAPRPRAFPRAAARRLYDGERPRGRPHHGALP